MCTMLCKEFTSCHDHISHWCIMLNPHPTHNPIFLRLFLANLFFKILPKSIVLFILFIGFFTPTGVWIGSAYVPCCARLTPCHDLVLHRYILLNLHPSHFPAFVLLLALGHYFGQFFITLQTAIHYYAHASTGSFSFYFKVTLFRSLRSLRHSAAIYFSNKI